MTSAAGPIRHLYIHVPFCSRRCSYCDFSIAVRSEVPAGDFVKGIVSETGRRAGADGLAALDTIYLGGGTPSKLGAAGVAKLLQELARTGATAAPEAEVTVEANPEDLTESAAVGLLAAGVNRLSIGVQSFDRRVLDWMHRTHSADQAASAVAAARRAGFENLSIDLIYALPARLARSWSDDLRRAIDLDPDHLSVYGLTVEPRTPLGRWTARGEEVVEGDDAAARQFLEAHERLIAAGYEHYEVSSYAKPGRRSRHNSAYWTRVAYLGVGPSAHSFDGATRRWNIAAYAAWEQAIAAGKDPVAGSERLTADQEAAERTYLGLRTDAGARLIGGDAAHGASWVNEGWAVTKDGVTRLAPEGWLRLDALAGALSTA